MPPIKKETLKIVLFHEIARYLAELTLENGNFNKLLGSRKLVREIDKKSQKFQKIRKMSKLIQTHSPFISYWKEEPAQETQTSCCFP